jgi:protein O-mannosyl-transferase
LNGSSAISSLKVVPLHYRLKNIPVAYVEYLLKLAWPAKLAVLYPLADVIPVAHAVIATTTLLLISLTVWYAHRLRPYLLVGWLWFLGTLIPVIGLIQVGGQAFADRYTYFPAIGIFIIATFGARDLASRFQISRVVVVVIAATILAACLAVTNNQLRYWRNSETLFRHALAVTKDNYIAHLNLGGALELDGKFDEAIAEDHAAEKIEPNRSEVHNNLGNCLDGLGKPDKALIEYQKAIFLNPNTAFLHNNAGIVLAKLGRFHEALTEFTNAIQLDPANAAPHVRMGDTLLKQGLDAEAIVQFKKALKLDPLNFKTLAHTAYILSAIENPTVRDGKTALILAIKANVLAGGSQPVVFDILGMAFAENGNFTNAQICALNAFDLATAAKMKNLEPIRQRLELYKNHQPWRESFLATNAPPQVPPKN